MFDFLAPDGGLRRFENLRINYSLKRTQNLRLKCLKLLKMFMVEKKTNRSTQDRKINRNLFLFFRPFSSEPKAWLPFRLNIFEVSTSEIFQKAKFFLKYTFNHH